MKAFIFLCFLGLAATAQVIHENLVREETHELLTESIKAAPKLSALMMAEDPLVEKLESEMNKALLSSVESDNWLPNLRQAMTTKRETLLSILHLLREHREAAEKGLVLSKGQIMDALNNATSTLRLYLATKNDVHIDDMTLIMQQNLYQGLLEVQAYARSNGVKNEEVKGLHKLMVELNEEQLLALSEEIVPELHHLISEEGAMWYLFYLNISEGLVKIADTIYIGIKNRIVTLKTYIMHIINRILSSLRIRKKEDDEDHEDHTEHWEISSKLMVDTATEAMLLIKNQDYNINAIWESTLKELLGVLVEASKKLN